MTMRTALLLATIFPVIALADTARRPALLPENARLAIVGDSITEQKLYSKYIEAYLIACAGLKDAHVFQFGWGGETAGGFSGRLKNDLGIFSPTTVTLCYGMNDGRYQPFNEDIGRNYETTMRNVLQGLKEVGIKHVVVGSPGAVDTFYFKRDNFAPKTGADGYNDNLNHLGQIGKKLAGEFQWTFANVHQPMIDAMAKAKPVMGERYDVCGPDGFHPGPNGHLIMAYAFLKGLGCDGQIAEIVIDLKGAASASAGHKVLATTPGTVELESERYPFVFDADPKISQSTRSITPFTPFNQELNRFTLKVSHLDSTRAKVEWGVESKEFTRDQLASGINLAAEFVQTPFDPNFRNYLNAVGAKQAFETGMIKNMITHLRGFEGELKSDAELAAAVDVIKKRTAARQTTFETESRKVLAPVKHTIKVTPLN